MSDEFLNMSKELIMLKNIEGQKVPEVSFKIIQDGKVD